MKLTKKGMISLCICVLALVSIVLMFAPYVSISAKYGDGSSSYSGFEVAFGSSDKGLAFSFFPFLVFIFFIAIMCLALLTVCLKGKNARLFNLLILIIAVIAAILLFCAAAHGFMWSYSGEHASTLYDAAKQLSNFGPGIGAIISAVLMIVCGLGAVANEFVIKD